ncbi:tail fiber domain-containing protein [Pantoea dispersa]|uniref:tail fiber domain-containing protein n=1 Tax=Pantoea dispersa TaxID=59814 RepID=UPI0032ECB62D
MPAGTIALTNNSPTVTGSGTSFTTELKVNDFVVSTVGGVAYTLGVKSIESNTSLTLMENYTGPSASGQSWTPVPYGTMAAITAQLAAQVTYAVRGFNLDKVNWQQIFTGSGTVTVNLPDGTSWQGPSWGYMATQFGNKLDKAQNLNDLTDKSTARTNLGLGDIATLNGPLAINKGGTGSATPFGTAANTFAQGNDSRLGTINNKTGGTLTSEAIVRKTVTSVNGSLINGGMLYQATIVDQNGTTIRSSLFPELNNGQFSQTTIANYDSGSSTSKYWNFKSDGNAYAINGSWQAGSDARLKTDIKTVDNALQAVLGWRGATWNWKDKSRTKRGLGYIADDIEKVFPDAISHFTTNIDGEEISDTKAIDPGSIAAAYHTEAIKSLFSLIELALVDHEKALACVDSIKASLKTETIP